jgi:nifR3 family TIM-barrel protein
MKISDLEISGKVALAPMASVADRAYRTICKKFGACYVVSEMVSAKGICYNDSKTAELCGITDFERPLAIQLFGNEPDFFSKATRRFSEFKPDIIDINMGCPVAKIVKQGAGAALMKTPELAGDLVKAVKSETNIPVTVKIRVGWEENTAVEFAQKMEKSGAAAIAVHGRTKQQFYSGDVNFTAIKQVKENVNVPVIGNGDINSLENYKKMLKTGVDLVMIGRGSYGNPWIFKEINQGEHLEISLEKRLETALYHVKLLCEDYSEELAVRIARRVVSYYLKGLRNSSIYRNLAHAFNSYSDILELFNKVRLGDE